MTRPGSESAIAAREAYIASLIAKAPPLSSTQRQLLTVLLRPRGGASWEKN
jgi:hypothetical protein